MGNLSGDLTKWTLFVIASNLTFENISTLLRTLHIQFSRRLEWNIMMGITEIMRLPHVLGSTDVVLVKLTKHRRRIDLTPCVVGESVSIRNLAKWSKPWPRRASPHVPRFRRSCRTRSAPAHPADRGSHESVDHACASDSFGLYV